MKAITLWQPWASLVADGIKPVENRGIWRYKHRGRIAIHAAKIYDNEVSQYDLPCYLSHCPDCLLEFCNVGDLEPRFFPRGAIVGTANLVDVIRDSDSPWAVPGAYHLVLKNAKPLATPVPYRGQQGLWNVPDELIRKAA